MRWKCIYYTFSTIHQHPSTYYCLTWIKLLQQGIDYFPIGSRWVLFSVCFFLSTCNITVAPFRCAYKAVEHTSSCMLFGQKNVQTTSWNKYKFLPSYIKQYWMGTDMEARDDVMLVFFLILSPHSLSNSYWMIFECCFYGDRWTLFTCQRSLYVTMCLVRRGLNTEKLYWGRILYYAGHTCACCHHTVPVQSLQFL